MVQTCVAFLCKYRCKKDDGIHLHHFPQDEEMKKQWMRKCRYWDPNSNDRVCSQHFTESDYASPTLNKLKHDAIPSLFSYAVASTPRKRPPPKDRSFDANSSAPSSSSSCGSSFNLSFINEEPCQKKVKMSPTKDKLKEIVAKQKRKIKTLKQALSRQRAKFKNLEDMYDELVKKELLHHNFAKQLQRQFPDMSCDIISNHFVNKDKKPQGHRHSEEAKKFALTLNFSSPRAYEFVRKIFSLPHPRSLSAWTSTAECEPGLFSDVFTHLQALIKGDSKYADATLVVDAMSIHAFFFISTSKMKSSFTGA